MRILLATYGSAGDLAPLVPLRDALEHGGHDTRLMVPRFLGLHLRRLGVAHIAYRTGAEGSALRDPRLVTSRFEGWESVRRLAVDHLARTLADDVAGALRVVDEWRPEVVVTTSLAVAPRVAASVRGIPHVELALSGLLAGLDGTSNAAFARPFVDAVRRIAGTDAQDSEVATRLAWGSGAGVLLLHDPVLLGERGPAAPPAVGYPYWDAFPPVPEDCAVASEFLDDAERPVVAVTLGSFVGRPEVLAAIADAVEGCGFDVLVMNTGGRRRDRHRVETGFVPLSLVASRCVAVVHHGGTGTIIGTIRAGTPSVIVPQAFDQCWNGRLVERAGLGRVASLPRVAAALRDVLGDAMAAERVRSAAGELVTPDEAVRRVCAHIVDAGGRPSRAAGALLGSDRILTE